MDLQFVQNIVFFVVVVVDLVSMKILSIFWQDKLINFAEMAYVILVDYNNLQNERNKKKVKL